MPVAHGRRVQFVNLLGAKHEQRYGADSLVNGAVNVETGLHQIG